MPPFTVYQTYNTAHVRRQLHQRLQTSPLWLTAPQLSSNCGHGGQIHSRAADAPFALLSWQLVHQIPPTSTTISKAPPSSPLKQTAHLFIAPPLLPSLLCLLRTIHKPTAPPGSARVAPASQYRLQSPKYFPLGFIHEVSGLSFLTLWDLLGTHCNARSSTSRNALQQTPLCMLLSYCSDSFFMS